MGAAGTAWSSSGPAVAVSCSLSAAVMVVVVMAMGVSLPAELCLALRLPSVRSTGRVCGDWFCRFAASSYHPAGLLLASLVSLLASLDSVDISVTALGCLVVLKRRTSPTCRPCPAGFSCILELSLLHHSLGVEPPPILSPMS